jgi:hypothetical protein
MIGRTRSAGTRSSNIHLHLAVPLARHHLGRTARRCRDRCAIERLDERVLIDRTLDRIAHRAREAAEYHVDMVVLDQPAHIDHGHGLVRGRVFDKSCTGGRADRLTR